MTDKEYLEKWLLELQEERDYHSTQLGIYQLNQTGLNVKRRVLQEMMFQYDTEKDKIREHLDYAAVTSELDKLNSDEQIKEESRLQEKIHVLSLAIQKIEGTLQHMNTPV